MNPRPFLLCVLILASINDAFSQQHFKFSLKKGLTLHFRGSIDINSRLDNPTPSAHDTIKDFVVSIDTSINFRDIQYIKFHSFGFEYHNKSISKSLSQYINIAFCNENGNGLLFYKDQIFQLKTSEGFYKKYLGEDLLLKKLLDSTTLQDDYDDIDIFPFIDPTNKRSCESYRIASDRQTKMMSNDFYCFNQKENVATPYGGMVTVFQKHNWASLNSPDSYYYYSGDYFISKLTKDFNIPGMNWVHYELTLYKIDD